MTELTFECLTALLRLYGLREERSSSASSFFGACEGTYLSATFPRMPEVGELVAQQARRVADDTGLKQWCWAQPGSMTGQSCWAMGATRVSSVALMSLAPGKFAPDPAIPALSEDVTVRWVDDSLSGEMFRDLHRAALSPAARTAPALAAIDVFAADCVLLHRQVQACVLLVDGLPASAGYVVELPRASSVHWVVTAAGHKRRGFATALMTHLMASCNPQLPIILQSTAVGFGLYTRLGFASVGLMDRWLVEPTA